MKRIFIFAMITVLAVGSVFAERKVLIDFSQLARENPAEDGEEAAAPENAATTVDYGAKADAYFTAAQREQMKSNLAIENWNVTLNSSAQNVVNSRLSYTREATSAKQFADAKVMGVRVHFPVESFNAYALIKPPFEIPAFELKDEPENAYDWKFGENIGVLRNVGTIKSIQVQAYGLRFPHSLSVILLDDEGNEKKIAMGSMNFEGWGKLIWNNPSYVQEVRNRALRLYPIYPIKTPLIKFGGFEIHRNAEAIGGDFITYFKDVEVIYDLAVMETEDDGPDINDEDVWGITANRENDRDKNQMKALGREQIERYNDRQRQATQNFDQELVPGAEQE